jgi:HAD superfamily hydrolase (TIGR01450 family)
MPGAVPVPRDLRQARGVVFDVDGTLVLGSGPAGEGAVALPGAVEAVARLRDRGIPVAFCTNGSNKTPAAIAENLRSVGIDAQPERCFTPVAVAAILIARDVPGARVLVLGDEGARIPLAEHGIEIVADDDAGAAEANVLLVAHDRAIDSVKLERAARALWRGAAFYVTATAPYYATRAGRALGLSALVGMGLAHVSGVAPIVTGKPSAAVMELAAEMLGVQVPELAVVGDDLGAEIGMARAVGATGVLVLTGTAQREHLAALTPDRQPDVVVETLTDLLELLP